MAESESGLPGQPGSTTDAAGAVPTVAGLTLAEIEAAAAAGRQLAGKIDRETALGLLRTGRMTIIGRLTAASNATFFAVVEADPDADGRIRAASAVYKPVLGERPLRDFPDGTLACREVAAHAVSEASGWEIVPPTVLRDGPFGEGMVQLWIETDDSVDLAELLDSDSRALRRMAVLDVVLNNADRKAGHLLPLPDGRIQGCDNGLTFSVEPKLRTVLWRWRGQRLNDEEGAVLERLRLDLRGALGEELRDLLAPAEIRTTIARVNRLLRSGRLPQPDRNRPAIPWPPY
jgi:uncharacterized repeat protein (TIGR03843 family)